jgi:VanZ family protein
MAITAYEPGKEAQFKGPTNPEGKWVGEDCKTLLKSLKKSVDKIFDPIFKKRQKQTKQVQKDFEKRKAGGFFEKITSGPLGEYQNRIQEVSTDPTGYAKDQQSFLDRYAGYFDLGMTYAGMTTDLVSGAVSNAVNELQAVNQISEAAGMGTLVPSGQKGGCNGELLVGTVTSLVRVSGEFVAMGAQQIFAAQACIGLAFEFLPDLYAGFMSMPAGTIALLLTNKTAILDRVDAVVTGVVNLARKLEAKDYPADHRGIIRSALSSLEQANDDLGQVEQTLEAGGKFLETNWDRAETTIDETGDMLLGLGPGAMRPGFSFVNLVQMAGNLKDLELLSQVLQDRQAKFQELIGYLGRFQSSFNEHAKFKNLMGPLIQQVRCVLQMVMDDMGKTLEMNRMLSFYLKEKQWGTELVGLAVMMKNMKGMGKPLAQPSTQLNQAADELSSSVSRRINEFSQAENYDTLGILLAAFLREMKRKMVTNVDAEVLAGIGDAILSETARLRLTDSELSEILEKFNSSFAKEGVVVAEAVTELMTILGDEGLSNIIQAIRTGDWESLFSLDALKSQLEGMARKLIGDLLQCCSDNAGDGDARRRLISMGTTVENLQKAKTVYDRYTRGFSERYLKTTYKTTIPALKQTKADVSRVSSSSCMNKGKSPGQASEAVGLTLY